MVDSEERRKHATIMEIIKWQEGQGDGFHGILRNPAGEDGLLSNIGGSTTWIPIENCLPDEIGLLTEAAQHLHNAMLNTNTPLHMIKFLSGEVDKYKNGKLTKAQKQ